MSGRLEAWGRTRLIVSLARQHARDRGFDGRVSHRRDVDAIEFEGMGLLELAGLRTRLAGLTEPQAEAALESRVNSFLQRHFELPTGWESDDERLLESVRRTLYRHTTGDPSPVIDEQLARFERLFGRPGWEERLRAAAHHYVERARSEAHLAAWADHALLIWVELGQDAEARSVANVVLTELIPRQTSDSTPRGLSGHQLTGFCFATLIALGRSQAAALLESVPDFSSSEVARALVSAADAAERGQVQALQDELDSATRWRRRIDRDNPHYVMSSSRSWHAAEAILSQWLSEVSGERVEPPVDSTPPQPAVTELWEGQAEALRWSGEDLEIHAGDGLHTISFGHSIGLAVEDHESHSSDHVEISLGSVTLRDGSGAAVVIYEEDPDEWNDLEIRWSPGHEYLALFPEHGPFIVVRRTGELVGEFFGHLDGPNLGATFAARRMVSWAGDGQLAIYDLDSSRLTITIDIDAWAEDAALDPTGRLVAALHPEGGWTTFDIDTALRVGPSRPAALAAWHPTLPIIAYADGDGAWIEDHSAE